MSASTQKRIMVDMSATLLHHGHVRLLEAAAKHGKVIVGLASDAEILKHKGFVPELSFVHRRELLLALRHVSEVVETPWLITPEILEKHNIDQLFHGNDNSNPIAKTQLLLAERTEGISSSHLRKRAVESTVSIANHRKTLFTPGPTNMHPAQLTALKPVFGRGDDQYESIFENVTQQLLNLTGHSAIACLQGSATLALEIAMNNFITGKVLMIDSGYYSQRLIKISKQYAARSSCIECIDVISDPQHTPPGTQYDWCIAVYTETARAYKNDIEAIHALCKKTGSRLLLDATGSIGLEDHHELADIVAYSSCKGLFGPTGAAFVAFHKELPRETPDSFYMSLETHLKRHVTGPYHALCVLQETLSHLDISRAAVAESKQLFMRLFAEDIVHPSEHQPLLCTQVARQIQTNAPNTVLYTPRSNSGGSVVAHLAAACLHADLRNKLYDNLQIVGSEDGKAQQS